MTLIASKIALPTTTPRRTIVPTRKPAPMAGPIGRRPTAALPATAGHPRSKAAARTVEPTRPLPISVPRSDVEPAPVVTRDRDSRGLARDGELNLRRYLREISDT
ncbi:MAG: hypothetical protein ACKPGI_03640, partial [Verrucomicrobiota bacterium]